MKLDWADEEELVNRYVRDEMSEAEIIRFEQHFLDQPEIIEKIELAQLTWRGMAAAANVTVPLDPSLESLKATRSFWPDLGGFPQVTAWATAFVILAVVSVAQFVYFNQQIEQLQAPQANTPILLLGQIRGVSDRDEPSGLLHLRNDIRWFSLELDLAWPQAPEYSMSIRDESNDALVTRVDQLTASLTETLLVTLPATEFRSGDYRLEVSAGDELVSSYRMRVIRQQ